MLRAVTSRKMIWSSPYKNNFSGQILYRNWNPCKKRRKMKHPSQNIYLMKKDILAKFILFFTKKNMGRQLMSRDQMDWPFSDILSMSTSLVMWIEIFLNPNYNKKSFTFWFSKWEDRNLRSFEKIASSNDNFDIILKSMHLEICEHSSFLIKRNY